MCYFSPHSPSLKTLYSVPDHLIPEPLDQAMYMDNEVTLGNFSQKTYLSLTELPPGQSEASGQKSQKILFPISVINRWSRLYLRLQLGFKVLFPIIKEFKPDLILISAGFDSASSASGDQIGRVDVSPVAGRIRLDDPVDPTIQGLRMI